MNKVKQILGELKRGCNECYYLDELLLEVCSRVNPRSNSVAKEDEIVDNSTRIDGYHVAHPTES